MNPSITLLIADDHEIFRDGLALMLSKQEDIKLIAQAENGIELIELTEKHQPDVILTDIKMPRMDGIEATRILVQKFPDLKIIALSMFDEENLIVEMLESGAKGYLLKMRIRTKSLKPLPVCYEDKAFYCKGTSARLASMIVKSKFNPYKKQEPVVFNDREKDIIKLICQQFTAQEIGEKLFLSKRTVEGYRIKILEKMNVKNTAGMVVFALKHNFIKESEIL